MRRVAVAVIAGGLAVALVVTASGGDKPARDTQPRARARAAADSACADLRAFERLVADNAPADRTLDRLDVARRHARAAAGADTRWQPLSSGADAVRVALDRNDARAAQVAIAVVRTECARL